MYVLDTNTLIYFFKGIGRVADTLLATPPQEVAVPTIVLYELEAGIAKSAESTKRRTQLDAFTEAVTVLPFDLQAAKCAAQVRAALERTGSLIGPMDLLIAGTALAHEAVLVTHDRGGFSRVKGLKIKDWY